MVTGSAVSSAEQSLLRPMLQATNFIVGTMRHPCPQEDKSHGQY